MTKHTNPTDSPITDDVTRIYGKTQVHHTAEAFAEATGLSIEMIESHGIKTFSSATGVPLHVLRLTWGERRALGVEYDQLQDLAELLDADLSFEQFERIQEIERILADNPLDAYTSEEIDAYNVEHFGHASGRAISAIEEAEIAATNADTDEIATPRTIIDRLHPPRRWVVRIGWIRNRTVTGYRDDQLFHYLWFLRNLIAR